MNVTLGKAVDTPDEQAGPVPALAVEGLTKRYGGHGLSGRAARDITPLAVDSVSFTVPAGGSLGIVGESGSGKTTIAKMLLGLERPTAGRILLDGVDHTVPPRRTRDRRRRGRHIQIVFQDPYTSLDRHQSVHDCLAEVVALHFPQSREKVRARVAELAGMVGFDDRQVHALPRDLSGGQRQRVAIARALAAEPRIVVLDESVAALDVSLQAQVLNLLADIRGRTGVSYVFISHDLAVIRQITDDTLVLHRGLVVERGSTAAVLDHPTQPYTRLLRDSVPRPGWTPSSARSARTTGTAPSVPTTHTPPDLAKESSL